MLFFLRPFNKDKEKDYVFIKKDNTQHDGYCSSPVGKKEGKNVMVLNRNCFDYHPIMHQFFHTLGFVHENQQPDYKKFIKSQ